ncbi:hypothetical protein [Oceanisphaera sp. KMM 10153]|uniref:hypothetical protein n=1 Tax=Oceanisphaera submarina TaxID=3390193 RepID=UPI003975898E
MTQSPQKQDAQFNQPAPPYSYHDDEISLIDLAKVMIKRRNWLFFVFIIGLLVTLLVAWLKRPQPVEESTDKAFTTLIAVGYKTPTAFIEPLLGVKTQLTDAFIPQASKSDIFNTKVIIENTSNQSNIIKLVTMTDKKFQEEVSAYHQSILVPLLTRHQTLIEEIKINAAVNMEFPPIATSVASLSQPLDILNPSVKSRTNLIVALGLVLSVMLAIIAVFLREFVSQVCISLRNDNK